MQWNWLVPIVIVVAISASVAFTTWVRARHGYPIEDDNGNLITRADPTAERKIELLSNENSQLKNQVSRLEERIAVLERIATDKPTRLSAEIDNLR